MESTIRDAMFRDYSCVLQEDFTGEPIGHDIDRSNHDASLLSIQVLLGWTSSSEEFVKAIESSDRHGIGSEDGTPSNGRQPGYSRSTALWKCVIAMKSCISEASRLLDALAPTQWATGQACPPLPAQLGSHAQFSAEGWTKQGTSPDSRITVLLSSSSRSLRAVGP